MASQMWVKLCLLILGVLVMVPQSMQLSVDHPLYSAVQKRNLRDGPYLGLVISSYRDEKLLKNSTYFTPDTEDDLLVIAGRNFHFGKFNEVPTVYVIAGSPLANVAATVQLLIDTFSISGIISYGAGGTVSNKVIVTSVVVPSQVAYIGSWTWEDNGSEIGSPGFKFGDFNLPTSGENSLGGVTYDKVPIYKSTSKNQKKKFFIDVNQEWVSLASSINYGDRPTVNFGVKVGSSDVYLKNKAYGDALNSKLGISLVDTESAAVVTTAFANGVKHIVFRGAANRPGIDTSYIDVANKNVLKVVAQFIDAAYPSKPSNKYSII